MDTTISRRVFGSREWTDDTNSHELLDYLFTQNLGEGQIERMQNEIDHLRKALVVVTALLLESGTVDLTRLTEVFGRSYGGDFKVNGETV